MTLVTYQGRWLFNQGMMSKKYNPSIFKTLFYFSLLFVKFIEKRRLSLSFALFSKFNIRFFIYNTEWIYSRRFEILGMCSIHIIHGTHATDIHIFIFKLYFLDVKKKFKWLFLFLLLVFRFPSPLLPRRIIKIFFSLSIF